jgi:dienelactone hydrolase
MLRDGEEARESHEGTIISDPEKPETVREAVVISTPRGTVGGVLHPAGGARDAVVMVGGAGGGIHGPAGVYEELAARLRAEGVTALRLEYRVPNCLDECVYDVLVAVAALGRRGVDRAALVGWSFGGAVVISAGAESEAVVGIATVASQTYGAGAVRELSPKKSLLLLHGTADRVLPARLSRDLYARAGEPKELVLYPRDGHGIEGHRSEMLEKLHGWCMDLLSNESVRGA